MLSTVVFAMTTLSAPIAGLILGGVICDNVATGAASKSV
jgi:hypothetical protein